MVKITFESEGQETKVIEVETVIGTGINVVGEELIHEPFYAGKNNEVYLTSISIDIFKHLLKQHWQHNKDWTMGQMLSFMQLIMDKSVEDFADEYIQRGKDIS